MRTEGLLQFLSVQLNEFLQRFVPALEPARRKLLWELVPGILASGSLRLSEIARTQIARPSELPAMEKHLSVQLTSRHWNHQPLGDLLLEEQAAYVKDDTVVAIDFSEVVKVYGQKLEYLDWVSDRSDPRKSVQPGYWLFEAYRVDRRDQVSPLWVRLFSHRQPGFKGQNDLLDQEFFHLRRVLNGRGIWTFDRGFDGWNTLSALLRYEQPRWVVRERGDRNLVGPSGEKKNVRQWAQQIRQTLSPEKSMGGMRVYLPQSKRPLKLITHRQRPGETVEPWMLLTRGFDSVPYTPRRAVISYVRRWRAEDAVRFSKQSLGLERFMVQYMRAMERLVLMEQLAFAFLAELVAEDRRAVWEIEELAFHFGEPNKIRVYRVARGIQRLASGQPFRLSRC